LTRIPAAVLVLLLFGSRALAQEKESLGLDLTEDEKKEEKRKKEELQKPEARPRPTTLAEDKAPAKASSNLGERDIVQEDRVKSVQRKVYLKKHRFELAPSLSTSINDPYYAKYAVSVRGAYYLADTLAFAARFSNMQVLPNDDVRTAKRNFQSRIFFSVPQWSAMGDVEWSPLYGKVAIFNSILHFDAYLLGGAGVIRTETSALPDRGLNPAVDLGIGMRFVAKDFLAVNVSLINTTYVDQPAGTTKGATQNLMMLGAGLSVFLPFKSTGREAE
jgi:outer membrane beta-barrel protein